MDKKSILKFIRINIPINLGPITQAKIESLRGNLPKDFALLQNPGLNMFVAVSSINRVSVVITPEQITIGMDGNDEEGVIPDFGRFKEILDGVYNSLLLDKIATAIVVYGKNYVWSNSVMQDSKVRFFEKTKSSESIVGIEGVGLRFFVSNEIGKLEFKIEPLLQNDSIYYFEGVNYINNPVELNEIAKKAEAGLKCFCEEFCGKFVEEYLK